MRMKGLTSFEEAVIEKLLNGDNPVLGILRTQSQLGSVATRDATGVGFYTSFTIPADAPRLMVDDFQLEDVGAEVDGLEHGAGFVLYVQGGALHLLEGYSYDEPWPDEIGNFQLAYDRSPRELPITLSQADAD